MAMQRTNIYADAADLALIKEAARRQGVPEAEIIRQGLRLAAMSTRVWEEPLEWPTLDGSGEPATSEEVTAAVARGVAPR